MLSKADIQYIKAHGKAAQRRSSGLFVAEGARLVHDMLGLFACRLLVIGEQTARLWAERLAGLSACMRPERVEVVPDRFDFSRISSLKTPQPILALFEMPRHQPADLYAYPDLMLYLDEVQDPGNLGTIIRTADWFGVRYVLLSAGCADPFSPKVVQATMGALARVGTIRLAESATHFLARYEGIVYGTFLDGLDLYQMPLSAPDGRGQLLVMGNEGNGISPEVEGYISQRLLIPAERSAGMGTESLNVAIATAICLSELRHPRG